MFCLLSAATLKKIQVPQKKKYTKLQLQQTLYNCIYGSVVDLQPTVGQTQPQPQWVQVLMPMPQHQQNYNYIVKSDGSTFAFIFKCIVFVKVYVQGNKIYKYKEYLEYLVYLL